MEHKILITGPMGAGKTTAIGQISEVDPVKTDVTNTQRDECDKDTTTAAFDYGEVDLGDGEILRLYGTPGQTRFSFMWPLLARGALGVVYLVDCSRPEPLVDLATYLDAFGAAAVEIPSVIAINKVPDDEPMAVETFQAYMEHRALPWPVIHTDVRDREQVLDLLEILFSLTEAELLEAAP